MTLWTCKLMMAWWALIENKENIYKILEDKCKALTIRVWNKRNSCKLSKNKMNNKL
jgi:hypothetical protein